MPPKILFFLWRCAQNALATNYNLARRNCTTSRACPICHESEETIFHCLMSCPHAKDTWALTFPALLKPGQLTPFSQWFFSL
ncbi:hypothetical protein LINGRAPRIM_LOCUS3052 [Linum grandiflorum]